MAAPVKINHGNIVRSGIGNIGAMAVRRDVDKVWTSVDADRGNDLILLGVNHAHVRRAGVDDVNFVPLRVGRYASRLVAPTCKVRTGRKLRRSMTVTVLLLPFEM